MKSKFFSALLLLVAVYANAQIQMSSNELAKQLLESKNLSYENVTFVSDLILPDENLALETGNYPENGTPVQVFTNFIRQSISFKNCTFKGKVLFCKKINTATSLKEYRVEFNEEVSFEGCIFEQLVDFELVNFNSKVNFKGTVFKEKARFVRMGLNEKPNLNELRLEKGCIFQLTQNNESQQFSADELRKFIGSL
jgi:hypothetical protein